MISLLTTLWSRYDSYLLPPWPDFRNDICVFSHPVSALITPSPTLLIYSAVSTLCFQNVARYWNPSFQRFHVSTVRAIDCLDTIHDAGGVTVCTGSGAIAVDVDSDAGTYGANDLSFNVTDSSADCSTAETPILSSYVSVDS